MLRINSYTQPVDNCGQKFTLRSGHAQVVHMLDTLGTLLARALRGSGRALKRIARPVAIVIRCRLVPTIISRVVSSSTGREDYCHSTDG